MAERAHPEHPGFQNKWFGLKKNKYRQKLFERYRFCNEYVGGKTIVDIPCGTGWGTSMLKGPARVYGFDISEEAIAYAKQHFAGPNAEYAVGDMAKVPLGDDSVDVVVCLEGFEHVSQETGLAFLAEARRVLRRGGVLLMTCPVLNERGEDTQNPHHLYEYPEEELIDLLNKSFRIERLERIQGPEGPEYRTVVRNFKDARYDPKP